MDIVWSGYITKTTGGKFFEIDDFENFSLSLQNYDVGTVIECIIRKPTKMTTSKQNRYYWGYIIKPIAKHTGHTPEEIHDILKWKFLKRRDDKNIEYVPSVSDLTTVEREEYHGFCRQWAWTVLDLSIPLPNEVDLNDDKDQRKLSEVNN